MATIFQCTPPHKLWQSSTPGHCVSKYKYFLGTAIPEVVTDFVILAMPLPYVWKLQMTLKRKLLLSIVFVLGGLYDPWIRSVALVLSLTRLQCQRKLDTSPVGLCDPQLCLSRLDLHNREPCYMVLRRSQYRYHFGLPAVYTACFGCCRNNLQQAQDKIWEISPIQLPTNQLSSQPVQVSWWYATTTERVVRNCRQCKASP